MTTNEETLKPSEAIQAELAELTTRHDELTGELETAISALDHARGDLEQATNSRNIDAVTATQSRVTALRGTLGTLERKISAKASEVSAAQEYEAGLTRARRLEEITRERVAAFDLYRASVENVCETVEDQIGVMEGANLKVAELTREAARLIKASGESASEHPALRLFEPINPPHKFMAVVNAAWDVVLLERSMQGHGSNSGWQPGNNIAGNNVMTA